MHRLSLVIPAYNEQDRLGRTLQHIADAWREGRMPGVELSQVIVVDDGSADRTPDIAREWSSRLPVVCVQLKVNRGKGAAVRAGVGEAAGDFVLLYDADGATPIEEVNKLFAAINGANHEHLAPLRQGYEGQAIGNWPKTSTISQQPKANSQMPDIAIGSRVLEQRTTDGHDRRGGAGLVTMQWHRRIIGRAYHGLCSLLVPGIHDTACGCKLFKTSVAQKLFAMQRIDRFAFDVEVLALALREKYRISEVPLAWTAVPESKVRIVRDGLQMFWCVLLLYVGRLAKR